MSNKSQQKSQASSRKNAGLSVQEIKQMTAMRMANQPNSLDPKGMKNSNILDSQHPNQQHGYSQPYPQPHQQPHNTHHQGQGRQHKGPSPSPSPVLDKPQKPQGLTVQELKELTRLRLAKEAGNLPQSNPNISNPNGHIPNAHIPMSYQHQHQQPPHGYHHLQHPQELSSAPTYDPRYGYVPETIVPPMTQQPITHSQQHIPSRNTYIPTPTFPTVHQSTLNSYAPYYSTTNGQYVPRGGHGGIPHHGGDDFTVSSDGSSSEYEYPSTSGVGHQQPQPHHYSQEYVPASVPTSASYASYRNPVVTSRFGHQEVEVTQVSASKSLYYGEEKATGSSLSNSLRKLAISNTSKFHSHQPTLSIQSYADNNGVSSYPDSPVESSINGTRDNIRDKDAFLADFYLSASPPKPSSTTSSMSGNGLRIDTSNVLMNNSPPGSPGKGVLKKQLGLNCPAPVRRRSLSDSNDLAYEVAESVLMTPTMRSPAMTFFPKSITDRQFTRGGGGGTTRNLSPLRGGGNSPPGTVPDDHVGVGTLGDDMNGGNGGGGVILHPPKISPIAGLTSINKTRTNSHEEVYGTGERLSDSLFPSIFSNANNEFDKF